MQYESVPQYDDLTKSSVGYSLSGGLRVNFARKVFSIVAAQLSLTTLICYSAMKNTTIETFCELAFFPAILAAIISSFWLYLSKSACRQYPKNMILLGIFTLSEAISVSVICLGVGDPDLVLQAFLITSGVVIALTAYAMTAKNDLTILGGTLFLLLCASLLSGLVYLIFRSQAAHLLYLFIGVVIFGFYLIYDIQLICGDKTLALSIDDYVLGSILIYTDIIRLFIRILKLLQEQKKKD